jgi:hypothetical protein
VAVLSCVALKRSAIAGEGNINISCRQRSKTIACIAFSRNKAHLSVITNNIDCGMAIVRFSGRAGLPDQ